MAVKSFLKDNNSEDYIPEKFPLTKGMKGKNIEALQKELKIPQDECLGLQTEHHINNLGYTLPLSEEDYKKIVKAEHVKIYEWIIENINKSSSPFQLDGCLKLVEFLRQRFKKNPAINKEVEGFSEILEDSIRTKRQAIHTRTHRDRKNNS